MILSNLLTKIYKKALFNRCDYTDDTFYFDYKDFVGLNKLSFDFTSKNGAMLKGGFYFYDEGRTDKLVIFDHGMGAGHRPYMREIETLCKAGYTVYSYDHEGCAESEGASIRGLGGSLSDLDDCLNALKKTTYYSGREIIVIGHSWGGFSAKNIAAIHPEVSKVIAFAGFSSVGEALDSILPKILHFACSALLKYEETVNQGYTLFKADESLNSNAARAMIFHSSDDPIVAANVHQYPLEQKLRDNPNVVFVTVDKRGHNPNYTENAVKLLSRYYSEKKKLSSRGKLKTKEQKNEFLSHHDFLAMTEQDTVVWNKVFDFIES